MKILLATRNKGKVKELATLLGRINYQVVGIDAFDNAPLVIEDGATYEENAMKKASALHEFSGLLTIADDSGIEVDSLNGLPGIYSARFAGPNASDENNNIKLLELLKPFPDKNERTARFKAAIALKGDNVENVFIGTVEGAIASEPVGQSGFGYDPLFIPDGFDQTFGQLDKDVKNQISHRAKALNKLIDFLKTVEKT